MLAERNLDMAACKEYAIVRYFVKDFVPDFGVLFPFCSRSREHLYPLQHIDLQSLFPFFQKSLCFLPKKIGVAVRSGLGKYIFEREQREIGNKSCKWLEMLHLTVPVFVPDPKISGTPKIACLLTQKAV